MQKVDKLKQKMFAIEILQILKQTRTYEELSKIFGLPVPVLSRYINGHVLPNQKKTKAIIREFKKKFLTEEMKKIIKLDEAGHFDHTKILFNSVLLKHIAKIAVEEFNFVKVDKIVTAATDGIPIGVFVGNELSVNTVYAKKEKDVGVKEFIEERVVIERSGISFSLYVPSNSIRKGENILIVDDAIRSGRTPQALVKIIEKSGANVVGIFSMISIGEGVKKLQNEYAFPIKCFLKI